MDKRSTHRKQRLDSSGSWMAPALKGMRIGKGERPLWTQVGRMASWARGRPEMSLDKTQYLDTVEFPGHRPVRLAPGSLRKLEDLYAKLHPSYEQQAFIKHHSMLGLGEHSARHR